MATQFVKWWKGKFTQSSMASACGGYNYKTMSSVLGSDGSDGRPSDTEDLVRDDGSSCHNGAHVNAGLAPSTASDNSSECSRDHHTHHHLHDHPEFHSNEVKFEDFECNVQVEGSESGEERKEFSFTFYDLDGHGKITKDDIAGLVRSIYGAVNDSITVPTGGKKTIKVRLTVTPEQQQQQQKEAEERKQNETNNNNPPGADTDTTLLTGNGSSRNSPVPPPQSRPKLRNNFNVTIQENLNRYRAGGGSGRRGDRFTHSHAERPRYSSVRIPAHPAHKQPADCVGCRLGPEVIRDCGASPMRHRKKWRERLQRPDLFELLQANMEKNNVSPCCRAEHNPVLNNENLGCKGPHNCSPRPKCPVPNPACAKLNPKNSQSQQPCRKHHRSRSHDLSHQNSFKYHLFGESRDYFMAQTQKTMAPAPCTAAQCSHEQNLEILTGCLQNAASPRNKNNKNMSNNNIINQTQVTPHQLKHRNREQDHARAMAQVINWLERESIGEKGFSPKKIMNPCSNLLQKARPVSASPPVLKKHEHHHVHEHIHHHYHHHFSKETPIIV